MANGGGRWKEKDVTDAGLMRLLGVRSALHSNVLESIPVVDETIRKEIPGVGPGSDRYLGDRYNYEDSNGANTKGMAWPLLTGERGHYEIVRAQEEGHGYRDIAAIASPTDRNHGKDRDSHRHHSRQQVRDTGNRAGMPTGAAIPLAWSHAEYIKLLRSAMDGKSFDLLPSVRERTRQLMDR